MAAPKRSVAKRESDLEIIASQYLSGVTQAKIAVKIGVSRTQITYDLATLRERWQAAALQNIDERKAIELQKIDVLERTYWRAWRRSCKDKEVKTAEKTTGNAERTKAGTRREGQSGNPAFLLGVQWCIEQRCKILGIVAPDMQMHLNVNTVVTEDANWYGNEERLRQLTPPAGASGADPPGPEPV